MIYDIDILNAKILIVDDNKTVLSMLEHMLNSDGYTSVLCTTDSREVMKLYESFQPDLILLDINMPYLDGYQIMELLKKAETVKDDYVPIIVLTAQQDKETRLRSFSLGAKDYLTKPFDQIEALTRIRNVIEVRLLHSYVRYQKEVLEDEVKVRTKELQDSRLEVIHRLGLAAEFKDNETGFHIIRISKMCELIGKAIGLPDKRVELLLHASPMHDIGKIGIPDSILLKPGKLDKDEWEIMKTHTIIGAKMLEGHSSPLLQMGKEVALTHHEKWDGSGYPNGLSGEQIPITGRITALADVFDALTSDRPYKKAWSVEDALSEINSCNGSHFDPKLVDIFNTILKDIISVRDQYKEPEK
jgi:putative two-component system response regulator